MNKDTVNVAYAKLQRLLQEAPTLSRGAGADDFLWLGRVGVIVEEHALGAEQLQYDVASQNLHGPLAYANAQKIKALCYRVLARLEEQVSPSLKGKFIASGSTFEAFSAIAEIIAEARTEILFVDPYASAHILTELAPLITTSMSIRILGSQDKWIDTLRAALPSWNSQHGTDRPVEVRKAPPKTLHDRVLVIDGKIAWSIGQSLKDIAKSSMTTIIQLDAETAELKIEALEDVWARSEPIV